MTWLKRIWMDGNTMRVDEISPEDFYRSPKEASMTDKIDTSTLGRIDIASGKSPEPLEECISTWAVDDLVERLRRESSLSRGQGDFVMTRHAYLLDEAADRIQSLIADNERLENDVAAIREALDWAANDDPVLVDQIRERALLSRQSAPSPHRTY